MAETPKELVIAIQHARAGLTTGDSALFMRGVTNIKAFAKREEGLSAWDITQIIRVLKFLFDSGGTQFVDGLIYGDATVNEHMARMVSDLIAKPPSDA
jgi:hypothetical protein